GFNSIIGPNGSGKSNVIDSLLFVFGYRATKIRSKNVSFLIHKSRADENIDSCSVLVHFAKVIATGNENDIIEGSEFSVGRIAFQNNTSFYILNNHQVKFKEISEYLHKNGIYLTQQSFLILQGEVESIALMKPKGRNENDTGLLEFLEDIIGTSRLKQLVQYKCAALVQSAATRSSLHLCLKSTVKGSQNFSINVSSFNVVAGV
ncbi:structural maintenance of chromosomes protein 4-like, partial [Schistocerca gregaria]|uniref:structural maintenance of chromosomes protein 4-like n=1 Tax=Schistocerca gregaria TaxID=7010 RepID=UPI00211E603F